jgi:TRAP-type C4-dicarboxylate transport system substrate-binding protein
MSFSAICSATRLAVRPVVALVATVCLVHGISVAQPLGDGSAAAGTEVKVSVAVGPAFPLGHAAERWVAGLNAAAGAATVAKLHPGATLAGRDPARELLALAEGRADLAVGAALQWSMQVPALAVFALPWIAPQDRDLVALAGDAALREVLARRLGAAGVVLVALAPLGYREIATTGRAIRAPEDLAGLRLRTAPVPLLQEVLAALGAAPQAMPFARAQAAFAAGTLDGQEGPPTALAAGRAAAFGPKHLTDWGAFADVMVFAVRKAVWDGWPEAQRDAVREAAEAAIRDTDALGREARAIEALARRGVAVLRVTPAGHDAFRAAVRDVDARWREVIGADVVGLAEAAVAGARAKPGAARDMPR